MLPPTIPDNMIHREYINSVYHLCPAPFSTFKVLPQFHLEDNNRLKYNIFIINRMDLRFYMWH